MPRWKLGKGHGESRYSVEGKVLDPLTDEDFIRGMQNLGAFKKESHAAFCVLLYYSAVRKTEALRAKKEQFILSHDGIFFEVGQRLKHSLKTPALLIPFSAPYVNLLRDQIENTEPNSQVFKFCSRTAYNVVRRAFKYPHLFRLSRITNFFLEGWTIAQVRSWTGLSLRALEFYVGLVDILKMGESLGKTRQLLQEKPSLNPSL
jgi:integrase